jgi:hypothetical protein
MPGFFNPWTYTVIFPAWFLKFCSFTFNVFRYNEVQKLNHPSAAPVHPSAVEDAVDAAQDVAGGSGGGGGSRQLRPRA